MSRSLVRLARGDLVTSDESGGMIVELGEKVTFFVDGEKVLTLGSAVVMALDGTLGRSSMAGDDTCCDFASDKAFNLRRKISDKDFNALDVSFLSLNRGSNFSEDSVLASLFAASKDSSRIVF